MVVWRKRSGATRGSGCIFVWAGDWHETVNEKNEKPGKREKGITRRLFRTPAFEKTVNKGGAV